MLITFMDILLRIFLMLKVTHLLHLYWAIIVDVCTSFSVLWRIVLPNSSSALVALAVVTFLSVWNDVFWPLIALSDQTMYTLPVGLSLLNGEYYGTPGPGV